MTGVLTGKGLTYGGSLARTEATGYGLVYFTEEMLGSQGQELRRARPSSISGSRQRGHLRLPRRPQQLGAKVVAMSDSNGYIYDPERHRPGRCQGDQGSAAAAASRSMPIASQRANITEGCSGIWSVPCDIALPCATQNELDAGRRQGAGRTTACIAVAEGANMPTTLEATEYFQENGVLFAPARRPTPAALPPPRWK